MPDHIKTQSTIRSHEDGSVFYDVLYELNHPTTNAFVATVKVTVQLELTDGVAMVEARANGDLRAKAILSEVLSNT